jgi:hypothetical protein
MSNKKQQAERAREEKHSDKLREAHKLPDAQRRREIKRLHEESMNRIGSGYDTSK